MYLMLANTLKAPVTRILTPICKAALKVGITPNAVTIFGTVGVIFTALFFYPRGDFVRGTPILMFFIGSDLLDGTMARLSAKGATRWGALLDSTLDRISDSAILIGLLLYCIKEKDSLIPLLLISLVAGSLISYIKARAEGLGILCNGGIAERPERLILILAGLGCEGLGIKYALAIFLWILTLVSLITVLQRLVIVYRGSQSLQSVR